MRLVPAPGGQITAGKIEFNGQDLLKLDEKEMRALRGDRIAMIFQDPMTSLNPVLTVGRQLTEAIRLHMKLDKPQARQRAIDLLARVGIPSPEKRLKQYPHEFSGGMRQRVMIAMALSCNPTLLIADEPTTALDVTIQAQILEVIEGLKKELGMAVIMITHDLGVVAGMADRVVVMYAGRVVEEGTTRDVLEEPAHALHHRPPALDPASRRRRRAAADPDPRRPAQRRRAGAGVSVRAALRLCGRGQVRPRGARAARSGHPPSGGLPLRYRARNPAHSRARAITTQAQACSC